MVRKDWSNYGVVALLPFLLVVVIYTTEAFTRTAFFVCKTSKCESIPENIWNVLQINTDASPSSGSADADSATERNVRALRYSGRINWFLLGEIFIYVCIASLGIAAGIVSQLIPQRKILWILVLLIFSVLVGFFFYRHPEVHMAIFLKLFDHAISPDLPAISDMTNRLNSLGNAALFSLLFTTCFTLIPSQTGNLPDDLKQVSTRMKYLRIILYTGMALLVTAVLLKKTIYQWSLAYTPQDDTLETARNFVAALLTLDGGFYTLVLAAAYFPASFVLHRRAEVLVGPTLEQAETESKLKVYGLSFSLKDSLPRILAIMAPFLTGPLAELVSGKFF